MKLALLLFLIGIYGIILNRKHYLLMIIAIEIILLAVTILVLYFSILHDDILAQIFGLYIISIAAAESAIALSILVAYHRLRGTINITSSKEYLLPQFTL